MKQWDQDILAQHMEQFSTGTVLCVGDVILDHFVYGAVERISPEAPVPILRIKHTEKMLGGAGNVVRNITSLGGQACFISVIGDDEPGSELTRLIAKEQGLEPYLQKERGRISTVKTRFIAGNQQLLRTDNEVTSKITEATQTTLLKLVKSSLSQVQALVLSDYGKGVLSKSLLKSVINAAKKAGVPVIVDPKRVDMLPYAGADVITPNTKELAAATEMPAGTDAEVVEAAKALSKACGIEHVLVTRSKQGMTLVSKGKKPLHLPATAREVYDVSGAGDTVVACLATALAAKVPLEEAAYLANVAAGIAVSRLGTARVEKADMHAALLTREVVAGTSKILPLDSARAQAEQWRQAGKKIGFTNGCFDLIHPGHISLMDQAKSACDRLIVGVNSDASVRRLKGASRPIQSEMARALVLASLQAVDMVVVFQDDTPLELITTLRPDVLVKGADYALSEVVGRKEIESWGGKVVLAQLSKGQSTTNLVKKFSG